jgi:hypothetical protein
MASKGCHSTIPEEVLASADAALAEEQEKRRIACEAADRDEHCRETTRAFGRATEALWRAADSQSTDPGPLLRAVHECLLDSCLALEECGWLAKWEQADHQKIYAAYRQVAFRQMSRPSYQWAQQLFNAGCKEELSETLIVQTWQKQSLRDSIRWLRIFVYGLSGEGGVLPEKQQASGFSSKPESPLVLAGDEDAFADFAPKQRKLLRALQGKQSLAIPAVKQAVYGTQDTATSTLEQLVTRSNRRLVETNLRVEIKRKSNTLMLQVT